MVCSMEKEDKDVNKSFDTDKHQKKMEQAKATQNTAHPHHGHRERMRNRFIKSGLNSFEQHEMLELLLFYALPRVNTNPIAHELINQFHSLSGVLDADMQDLKQIKGISENAAVFLKLIPQISQQYQIDRLNEHQTLDTEKKIQEFIQAKFCCCTEERVILLCLGEYLQLIDCSEISIGTVNGVTFDVHRIVECAIRNHSKKIILAHNHPHTEAIFSDADLFTTENLKNVLEGVQIQLLDHVLIGKQGDFSSMRKLMDWG